MGRFGNPRKRIWDVQREFSEDFTVVNESLLLCKFCNSTGRSESSLLFQTIEKFLLERKISNLIYYRCIFFKIKFFKKFYSPLSRHYLNFSNSDSAWLLPSKCFGAIHILRYAPEGGRGSAKT